MIEKLPDISIGSPIKDIMNKINELVEAVDEQERYDKALLQDFKTLYERVNKLEYIVNRMDAGLFGIEYEQKSPDPAVRQNQDYGDFGQTKPADIIKIN